MLENNGQIGINRLTYFVHRAYKSSKPTASFCEIAEQYYIIRTIQDDLKIKTSPENLFQSLVKLSNNNCYLEATRLYHDQEVSCDVDVDISYDSSTFTGYNVETSISNLNEVGLRDEYPESDEDMESNVMEYIRDDVEGNGWYIEGVGDLRVEMDWEVPYLAPEEDDFLYAYEEMFSPDSLSPDSISNWVCGEYDAIIENHSLSQLQYKRILATDLLRMVELDEQAILSTKEANNNKSEDK